MIEVSKVSPTVIETKKIDEVKPNVQVSTTTPAQEVSPFTNMFGKHLKVISKNQGTMPVDVDIPPTPALSEEDQKKAKMLALMGKGISGIQDFQTKSKL